MGHGVGSVVGVDRCVVGDEWDGAVGQKVAHIRFMNDTVQGAGRTTACRVELAYPSDESNGRWLQKKNTLTAMSDGSFW